MASKSVFAKKTTTKYALVHRSQNDPLIHDDNAPSQVFTQIAGPSGTNFDHSEQTDKIKRRVQLEDGFNLNGEAVPENEEVAAEHGILYNDNYDYLQHLRDLGHGQGESSWVEAHPPDKGKRKPKQNLEDALRDLQIDDQSDVRNQIGGSTSGDPVLNDQPTWQRYQEQQDIQDEIAGFQPDMDPRLREVLDALDDEAYVDDDQDIFDELAEGGEEIERDIWEGMSLQDEEDGWESDDTAKAMHDERIQSFPIHSQHMDDVSSNAILATENEVSPSDENEDGAFLEALAKAKTTKASDMIPGLKTAPPIAPSAAFTMDSVATGGRKKRKGALTSSTGFSMTSSALARTEALSTLDSRFDRILDSYMDDIEEDEEAMDDNASAVTSLSRMTGESRMSFASRPSADDQAPLLASNAAFTSTMEEYLGYSGKKGKRMKKAGKQGFWGQQSGMKQLDEVRAGLGPARVRANRPTLNV